MPDLIVDLLQLALLIGGVAIWLRGGFSGVADSDEEESLFFREKDSLYNHPHDIPDPGKFDRFG